MVGKDGTIVAEVFALEIFANLAVLLVLQAVLGLDNLLYISIASEPLFLPGKAFLFPAHRGFPGAGPP